MEKWRFLWPRTRREWFCPVPLARTQAASGVEKCYLVRAQEEEKC